MDVEKVPTKAEGLKAGSREETIERLRQAETLLAVSQAISSTLDLTETLRRVSRETTRALGADTGGAYVADPDGGVLRPVAGYHVPKPLFDAFRAFPIPLKGHRLLEEAWAHQRPVFSDDAEADPRIDRETWARFPHRSILFAPMDVKGEPIGGLLVIWWERAHQVTPDELRLVEGISRQAALAIDNAQLYGEAERRRREAEVMAELASSINASLDLGTVLQRVAGGAKEVCGSDLARIALRDPGSEAMVVRHWVGVRYERYDAVRIEPGKGVGGQVLVTERPFRTANYAEDPRISKDYLEVAREEGVVTELAVPIRIGDRVEGVLYVDNRSPRPFTDRDEAILQRLADHAATAIQNARLFDETERRRRVAEGLAEVGRLISQSLDPKEVGQRITDSVRALLDAQASGLYRMEPGSGDLVAVAMSGDAAPTFDGSVLFPQGTGLVGLAVRERRPMVTPDVLADPRITLTPETRAWIEQRPFRAILAVPLLVKDRVIGALGIGGRGGRVFDPEEIRLAEAFAAQAALAFQNARLFDETERRGREAESLAGLGQLLQQSLDPEEVGQRIADSVCVLLGVMNSVLFRIEPESGDLVSVAISGDLGPAVGGTLVHASGSGLAGMAVRERHSVVTPNVLADPRVTLTPEVRARFDQAPFRAGLSVPLLVKDRVIGALSVGDREGRAFDAEEIRLVEAFAAQAALALENARLFEETRLQHQEAVALGGVAQEITSSLDRGEVFQRIVDRARGLCGSDLAFLAPYDREADTATVVAVSGARTEILTSVTIRRGLGTGGMVLETGEPFSTEDYLHDPRFSKDYAEAAIQEGFIAQAVVPLRFGEAITGLLWVVNRTPRRFTPRDMAVLTKLADQAAIALENSRLYGELRAALEAVETSQQRIIQTERLRALGEMAGGVAHDFNNVLAVILGRAQILLTRAQDPDLRRQLQVIEKVAADAAQTVRRIQEFTRMRQLRPFQSVDLSRVVEEAVELTRSRWKDEAQARGVVYDVRVETVPLPPVAGDPSELREVLTNLVLNALDAMPEGGRLTFRTGVEGERVHCVVTDTGIGMPEEVRRRIFDPFFTTKGPKGTGLGLSMVYGIITRHRGEIEVRSRVGQGSEFTIRLPVGRELPEPTEEIPSVQPPRRAKILVIDDEPAVRELLVELLTSQGHVVAACSNGRSGLSRFQAEPVDLVITDLGMPGLSGWEVAKRVKQKSPETPVVLVTGWGDQIDPGEARAKGVDFLLAKPFRLEEMTAVVACAVSPRTRPASNP